MHPNTGDREIYTSKFQLLVVKREREREKEDRESSYSYTYLHIGRYILGTVKEVGWRIHYLPTTAAFLFHGLVKGLSVGILAS